MSIPNSSLQRTAQVGAVRHQLARLDALLADGKISAAEAVRRRQAMARQLMGRKWTLDIRLLFAILVAAGIVLAVLRALGEREGLGWLFIIPPVMQQVGDIAVVLAPLVAVSLAIERLLETAFDWFEQATRCTAEVLAAPREALDWIGREYQEAYEAAAAAAEAAAVTLTPASIQALQEAEERLAKAEARLRSWTSAPEYRAWKRALSIWIGLLAGLVVAVIGDLGMFRVLGIPMPRILDMLVTGLIIGAGPGPMHSLIGILQSGKDAVSNLAELAKGKAVRDAAQAVLLQVSASKREAQ
ncbi:MAG: hypothetical protein NZ765_06145 [Anaerolineae bacterium]|nr:hypothetical protein [Anaerolineae bacterium]MDW8070035.1 hypothetical protein [Anaerolineae bacterium]